MVASRVTAELIEKAVQDTQHCSTTPGTPCRPPQAHSVVTQEDVDNLSKATVTDLSLWLIKFTAQAQGKTMGYLVATQTTCG